jgi:hypothetical protein
MDGKITTGMNVKKFLVKKISKHKEQKSILIEQNYSHPIENHKAEKNYVYKGRTILRE